MWLSRAVRVVRQVGENPASRSVASTPSIQRILDGTTLGVLVISEHQRWRMNASCAEIAL